MKRCNPSFAINSTNGQNEIELICSFDHNNNLGKPEYRVAGTLAPEPMCTQYCASNDDCVHGKEACVYNRYDYDCNRYVVSNFFVI